MKKETIEAYKKYGVDVNKALDTIKNVTISIHCWQLDDVTGFESSGPLTGGIQSTGDHPGKARNFEELTQDMEQALKYIPGKKKINLHSIYQTGNIVSRDMIGPDQFKMWVEWAKKNNVGLDYNPTFFSHPMVRQGLTLSSPDKDVRDYWIRHAINSIKVTEYFGKELGIKSLCNIWIPDGLKDVPADRMGPRQRLKESLDEIFKAYKYDKNVMDVSIESKLFGIGVESYTTGSHDFYLSYAMKNNILCLLDTGHFHPTENVADKISSLLLFSPALAFHVSRPVRWDSDHVLKLNDDLQDVANELVKCDALNRSYIGLDYFDGSLNRVAAIVIGTRNMYKAILKALLTPWNTMKQMQDNYDFTSLLVMQEEIKDLPFEDVWKEFCNSQGVIADNTWYDHVKEYEEKILAKRGN